jgi:hypothetical protein
MKIFITFEDAAFVASSLSESPSLSKPNPIAPYTQQHIPSVASIPN